MSARETDKKTERWVVVTTDHKHRGVFGGVLVEKDGKKVVLEQARMCVYWCLKTRGVIGLAGIGPQKESRITPATPRIELCAVSSISDMTERAKIAWESEPWG